MRREPEDARFRARLAREPGEPLHVERYVRKEIDLVEDEQGRRRMAVNVRLAPPEAVADLPIDRFDGLDSFEDLPGDGRCVRDMWF